MRGYSGLVVALHLLSAVTMAHSVKAATAPGYEKSVTDRCVEGGGSFDYQFGTCDSKRSHPVSSSPCVQNLPGRWRVVAHVSPGVSAMTAAEANAWNGSILTLQADNAQFRTATCSTPRFDTRLASADNFAENYLAEPSSLGLTAAEVCVTEISCNGAWNVAGGLLIHGHGKLFVLWDGVFFELRRE